MQPSGAFGPFSLGRVCPASGTLPRRVPRTQPETPATHSSLISRSSGTVFPARICRRDSKISSMVFTLKRSSRTRAIAYRTNSDFEGKPCSLDAAASSFACSFVSLRLIVSTLIVIRRYYLALLMGNCECENTAGGPTVTTWRDRCLSEIVLFQDFDELANELPFCGRLSLIAP